MQYKNSYGEDEPAQVAHVEVPLYTVISVWMHISISLWGDKNCSFLWELLFHFTTIFALLPFPFFPLLCAEVGFCDAMTTSDVDHGVYIWEETEVGSSSQTSCAFGPSNEQATRECERRSFWGEAQLVSCETQVSHAFMEFNESAVREMTIWFLPHYPN